MLRLLPRGTHEYEKLIKPSELARYCRDAGLNVRDMIGMTYNPFTQDLRAGARHGRELHPAREQAVSGEVARSDVRAVLFDLDGTLADTAPDLGYVLNLQRLARGLEELPLERLRPVVSQGARGLLRVGFGLTPGQDSYEAMRDEFLDLYSRNLVRNTRLFEGVAQLLQALERARSAWGVVTNKLARFTDPLLESLGLAQRAGCVISGDTCARAKPYPDPLLEAARRLGSPAAACMYIGDDERDVQAGRAAGMRSVVALYGYLGENPTPHNWEAHAAIEQPLDLLGDAGRDRRPMPTALPLCYIVSARGRAAIGASRSAHNAQPETMMKSKLGRALACATLPAALVAAGVWLPGASADQPATGNQREFVSDTFGGATRTAVTGQCVRTTMPEAGSALAGCVEAPAETAKAALPAHGWRRRKRLRLRRRHRPPRAGPGLRAHTRARGHGAGTADGTGSRGRPASAHRSRSTTRRWRRRGAGRGQRRLQPHEEIAATEEAMAPEAEADRARRSQHPSRPRTWPKRPRRQRLRSPPETSIAPPAPPAQPEPRRLRLAADTHFHFDRAQLTPAGAAELDKLVGEMGAAQIGAITIVGYTDRIGSRCLQPEAVAAARRQL